jgi:hypothetical protein
MNTPTPQEIATDRCASYWLKNAVATALDRDPLDALRDAEILMLVLAKNAEVSIQLQLA